jgi:ATP-dependent DNA helicase RecQ
MDTDTRRRNQERWTSDEVRVLVGTIAFGLGINKAAVRAVIHLSLPKSIEQYYQEAGRAGRDGEAADCILLWQKRDTGLLAHFIEQVTDPAERERGWQRYHAIRRFAESGQCRHIQICSHFGEKAKWTSCGACDVCGCESQWLVKSMEAEPPARSQLSMPEVTHVREISAQAAQSVTTGADSELRDYIREWRREMSKEQGVPAYIVMHDSSLEDLCRRRPTSLAELLGVSGFGERKTELYGQPILDALSRFDKGGRAAPLPEKKSRPAEDTLRLLAEGRTFEEIARIRGRQLGSVVGLVADLVEKGKLEFQSGWVDSDKQQSIESACARLGIQWLKPLKEALPAEVTFEEIRLIVARLRQQQLRESA